MIDLEDYREALREAKDALRDYQDTADSIRRLHSVRPDHIRDGARRDLSDKMVTLEKARGRYIRKLTGAIKADRALWLTLWQLRRSGALTLPQWRVLQLRYLQLMTWAQIGDAIGRSPQWVQKIHRDALEAFQGAQTENKAL